MNATGNSLQCYARCECGMEHDLDKDFGFDADDFVVSICDCGEEFCDNCKKECTTCDGEGCKTKVCTLCAPNNKVCEDCELGDKA